MYVSNEDKWSSLPALPYANFSLVIIPDRKQLLAIGGMIDKNKAIEITSKAFLWDEENRKWTTPYPNMPTVHVLYYCSSTYIPFISSDSSWWSSMSRSMDYDKSSGSASHFGTWLVY